MKAMAKMTLPRDYIASFTGEFNSNLYFALFLDLSSAILHVQVLHKQLTQTLLAKYLDMY